MRGAWDEARESAHVDLVDLGPPNYDQSMRHICSCQSYS